MRTKTALHIFLLLSLSYLLFFQNLGNIALWDPDEPRQAIMAREMMERRDYLHPYLNGEPYLEKPPLHPWAIVAAAKITGELNDYSARLPSAVAATLIVLMVYFFGFLIRDGTAGLFSAVVVMTNIQFLASARESVMDMTFACFIAATLFLGFAAVRKEKPRLMIAAFLPAGFAVLTKGPAGLLLPLGVLSIYCFLVRANRKFLHALVIGSLLAVTVAALWFLAAGEAYWKEFLFRQNILRFVKAFDHRESWLYYFPKLFFNFLPWSLVLPFSLYQAWRRKEWLPLSWFVVVFLFFEFSQSKRAVYLLPLYPAAAVICGLYLRDEGEALLRRKAVMAVLLCAGAVLALLPSVTLLFPSQTLQVKALRDAAASGLPNLPLVLMAAAAAGIVTVLPKRWFNLSMALLAVYLCTFGILYHSYYMPAVDRSVKSPHLLSDAVRTVAEDGHVYAYGFNSPGLVYHLGRPVTFTKDWWDICGAKRDILVVVEEPALLGKMGPDMGQRFSLVARAAYEKHFYRIYVPADGG